MAFIDVAIATGAAVGLEGTAAAIGGGALLAGGAGAVAGGLYNGLTGRSVLNGALMGGAIGAIGGATAGFGMAPGAVAAADATAVGMGFSSAAEAVAANPANAALLGLPEGTTAASLASMGGASSASAGWAGMGVAPGVAGGVPAAAPAVASGDVFSGVAGTTGGTAVPAAGETAANAAAQAPAQTAGATRYSSLPGLTGDESGNLMPQIAGYQSPGTSPVPNSISGFFDKAGQWVSDNKGLTAAGLGAAYLATRPNAFKPNYLPTYTPPTAQSMNLNARLSPNYRPTFAAAEGGIARLAPQNSSSLMPQEILNIMQSNGFAGGNGGFDFPNFKFSNQSNAQGHAAGGMMNGGIARLADGGMAGGMYPGSQIDHTQYASSPQTPASMQATLASYDPETNPLTGEPTMHMATGGISTPPSASQGITAAGITGLQQQKAQSSQPLTMDYIQSLASQYGVQIPTQGAAKGGVMGSQYNLGSYSDGGRLLKGPGDGMSDNIPASIAEKQPARLADGEFVVPADVVSHLGNGSTDAGAKHLYKMMDNVRKARTGRKAQGKQIKADKFLPK